MGTFWRSDDWGGGWSWIADPTESMQRASHAIEGTNGLWLVDPVDHPELDDEWEADGVAGVVLVLDRHKRNSAALARRYDVAVHVPESLAHVAEDLDAPTADLDDFRTDTGWEASVVVDRRGWHEVSLHSPEREVLLVPEAVGTAASFLAGDEKVGVHPMLRPIPPRAALGHFHPRCLLVGHGRGIYTDAARHLSEALRTARRRAPRAYISALRAVLPGS